MPIALISVPFSSTGQTTGKAKGPDALQAAGLLDALRCAGESSHRRTVSFLIEEPSFLR
jgi:hypothetical protein